MSCRFAGCPTPAVLWDGVRERQVMLTPPGPDLELAFGQRNVFDRPYPTRFGQLGELYACVPSMQNFPRQVNAGENQDLYFATQLAFDALGDAAMKPHQKELVKGSVRVGYAPPFNASPVNWLQHTYLLDQTLDTIRRFFPNAPETLVVPLQGWTAASQKAGFCKNKQVTSFDQCRKDNCPYAASCDVLRFGQLAGQAFVLGVS